METLHAIETGNLTKGSISQKYDCCPQPIDAFECIKNMSGICRDSDYPTALGSCQPNTCKPFTTVSISLLFFKDMNVKKVFSIYLNDSLYISTGSKNQMKISCWLGFKSLHCGRKLTLQVKVFKHILRV